MSTRISSLALAMLLGVTCIFPVVAAEQMSMEQIVELCEKEAENQDDPDAYFEKCVEEKGGEATESSNTQKAE